MARPRSIAIDVGQGVTKRVNFVFDDLPDLSSAVITLTVKKHSTDRAVVLEKQPDINLSPALEDGKFVIKFNPEDTEQLAPRTYVYELTIVQPDTGEVLKPLIGDFKLYPTLT